MERIFGTAEDKNNVYLDSAHRMPKRPFAIKSGEGKGFEDFGSSFGPPKPITNHRNSPKSKFKPTATFVAKARKAPPHTSENDSDDELLLSSQSSKAGHATSPTKRVSRGKKLDALISDEETVDIGGRILPAHPDFKPSSFIAIKGIRFTKSKKPTAPNDDVVEVPPPSSLPDSQDLFKPISDDIEVVAGPGPRNSRQKPSSASATRLDATRTATREPADAKVSSSSKSSPSSANETPRNPRPRPRVVMKSVPSDRDENAELTPFPPSRTRKMLPRGKSPEQHTNAERKSTAKKQPPSRREPQAFPMSLDAKENVSDSDAPSSKTKKASVARSGTLLNDPRRIPLPSPLKTEAVPRQGTFPNLSPLISSEKAKGKGRATTPDEDDADLSDHRTKRAGPKPFPMSPQMLAGIDRRSKSPSICSHSSAKRASSDDSGTEGRTAKKRKDTLSKVLDTLDYLHEPMEDDSFDLGYARDPSKICPYCDEDLPSHPTPFLQHLLTTARKKSLSDPRPKNRSGLKAPLTIYISVCQRHRFESHQLPIATAKGWPKTIDFAKVPGRVKMMKKALEAIIMDKDDTSDMEDLDIDDRSRRPRNKCFFWREVKKEVKKQGSRTVVGVKGQFASFEKTQPGYYGEQGSVIIHQTLFDLFPPSTFDASLIAPLAPAEFIQRILVPEAAVRLIAQDLGIGIQEAVATLRESTQYGVAMFPDTNDNRRKGTDDEEMGVADRIVMERARARRKELEEQERVEEEILEEERAAQRAKARESRWEKALERAQKARGSKARAERAGNALDVPETSTREPRRTGGADDSESDAMSVDSSTSRRSARIAKEETRGGGRRMARVTSQQGGSDSDSRDLFGDPIPKTRGGKNKIARATSRQDGSDSDSMDLFGGPIPKTRNGDKTKDRSPDRAHVDVQATVAHQHKNPFSGFTQLDVDGEHESTPRPVRGRRADPSIAEASIGNGRTLPLLVARNRQTSTHDGWSCSLRTGVPDDTDSDASRSSQRVVRAPIRKGRGGIAEFPWLLTDASASDSP